MHISKAADAIGVVIVATYVPGGSVIDPVRCVKFPEELEAVHAAE